MTRKLFTDMANDLRNRFTLALDRMLVWATSSHFSDIDGYSYDLTTCPTAYDHNIDEITYICGRGWTYYDQDGQQYDLSTIDLETLGSICDWIERTYSPTHKCGDRRI